jgi:hypothetical protein
VFCRTRSGHAWSRPVARKWRTVASAVIAADAPVARTRFQRSQSAALASPASQPPTSRATSTATLTAAMTFVLRCCISRRFHGTLQSWPIHSIESSGWTIAAGVVTMPNAPVSQYSPMRSR